jgi:hypothetical protein
MPSPVVVVADVVVYNVVATDVATKDDKERDVIGSVLS